jgi:hypothetical protein
MFFKIKKRSVEEALEIRNGSLGSGSSADRKSGAE